MPRHMAPDFREVGFAGAGFVDGLAVEHDGHAVGELQEFVEHLAGRS